MNKGMFDEDGEFTEATRLAIAKRMDQTIRLAKMTKAGVAERIGVSRAAITQYCQTGGIALPRLAAFCRVTKSSMDYIIYGSTPELETSLAPMIAELLEKRRTKAIEK